MFLLLVLIQYSSMASQSHEPPQVKKSGLWLHCLRDNHTRVTRCALSTSCLDATKETYAPVTSGTFPTETVLLSRPGDIFGSWGKKVNQVLQYFQTLEFKAERTICCVLQYSSTPASVCSAFGQNLFHTYFKYINNFFQWNQTSIPIYVSKTWSHITYCWPKPQGPCRKQGQRWPAMSHRLSNPKWAWSLVVPRRQFHDTPALTSGNHAPRHKSVLKHCQNDGRHNTPHV